MIFSEVNDKRTKGRFDLSEGPHCPRVLIEHGTLFWKSDAMQTACGVY